MKLSTDRILTTHVGSLPRGPTVLELLYKKENGEPYDPAEFDRAMSEAVDDVVRRQVATGIDIVSDGEMSKVGYATYIKDRLSGFDGHYPRPPHRDLAPYPELREAMARMIGKQTFKRAGCVGPVELVDRDAMQKDLANLRAAATHHRPHDAFMNAASPGVISAFQSNHYYRTHEAIRRRDRGRDEARVRRNRRGRLRAAARLPRPRDGEAHRVSGAQRKGIPGARGVSSRRLEPRGAGHPGAA